MRFSHRIFAFALLGVLNAGSVMAQQKGAEATVVKVDAVRSETSGQTVPVVGRLVPHESGAVAALISGLVESFAVEVGARVNKGDVLAQISPTTLKLQRDLNRAALSEAQARLNESQALARLAANAVKRLQGLRKSAAFNQGLFDDKQAELSRSESAVAVARASVQRAQANLGLAEVDLYNASIRAPYDGVVTERHTEVGSFLSIGGPVVSMVNDATLEIEVDVPFSRLAGLAPGVEVTAELASGDPFPATIRAVVPTENPRTRTRQTRLTPNFPEAVKHLAANQSVTVLLPIGGGKEMVTVAKDAVLRRGGGNVIFVVEDGKAQQKDIRIGQAVGARFQVLDGLTPGELAIVRGNERLRPGQAVTYE